MTAVAAHVMWTKGRGLPWFALAFLGVLGAAAAACGNDDGPDTTPGSTATQAVPATAEMPATSGELQGSITVFAASSLTDAFNELGEAFKAANPDVDIEFSFAASSALATQINEGAPADVFAAADGAQMRVVMDSGKGEGEPVIFATNSPVVVVPAGATTVATFEDLARPGIALVLAGPEVPIGRYARELLQKASEAGGIRADFSDRVLANLRSDEANVRAVLTKVQLGEADAGIVYQTDAATAAGDVDVIEIPGQYNVVAQYPIVPLAESEDPEAAAAFVEFALSGEGQAILESNGFGRAAGT
jgi:molybdate transport system substrate-binding protein